MDKQKLLFVFIFGAIGYNLIELAWRGRTHWTMTLAGGICFLSIYLLNEILNQEPLWVKSFCGMVMITAVELAIGLLANVKFGLAIWNYSAFSFHFKGQICPLYSLLWFLLCMPAFLFCNFLQHWFTAGNHFPFIKY